MGAHEGGDQVIQLALLIIIGLCMTCVGLINDDPDC